MEQIDYEVDEFIDFYNDRPKIMIVKNVNREEIYENSLHKEF